MSIEILVLFSLLFADDAVLFAKSEHELQNQLNHLHQYCKQWNITLNINKTKVFVFTKKRRHAIYNIKYGNKLLEQVESFVYLGFLLLKTGKLSQL